MDLATAPPPRRRGGSEEESGPCFFFRSGRCVPKPWNSPLCGMTTTCNFILHLEDWLFTICVKYFWKWCSWILSLLCNFCHLRNPSSLYCCTYEPKAQYFYEDRHNIYTNTHITYFEIYFYVGFSSTSQRCVLCRNAECVQTMLQIDC